VKRLKETVLSNNKNLTVTEKKTKHDKYDSFEYQFQQSYIHKLITENEKSYDNAAMAEECLQCIEVYYYHHRVILKFMFERGKKSVCEDRMLREFTKKTADLLLQSNFVYRINGITQKATDDRTDDKLIPYEKRVVLYYSYMVMFINNSKGFGNNIIDFLGSLTFRIVESGKIRFGHVHYVRISVPGMNVYFKKRISDFLKTDIINSVYQNALYQKKESDREETDKDELKDFTVCGFLQDGGIVHCLYRYGRGADIFTAVLPPFAAIL
jgi:hypothetical protein